MTTSSSTISDPAHDPRVERQTRATLVTTRASVTLPMPPCDFAHVERPLVRHNGVIHVLGLGQAADTDSHRPRHGSVTIPARVKAGA